MLRKLFNEAYIYVLITALYLTQRVFVSEGSLLARLFMIMYMVSGGYYIYKANVQTMRPNIFRTTNIFLGILFIYAIYAHFFIGGYVITENNLGIVSIPLNFAKNAIFGFMPMYAFYCFSKSNKVDIHSAQIITIIFLIISILLYFNDYEQKLLESLSGRTEFTNNVGYEFVALIPCLLFFYKSKFINIPLSLILVYFIINGMKRGAILIASLLLIIYFTQVFKNSNQKTRIFYVLAFAAVAFFTHQLFLYMIGGSEWFQSRLERTLAGDASNRESMYPRLINYFINESSFFNILFGSGADYTIIVADNYAHNDWLELAVDCGLVGVFIYSKFYIELLKARKQLINTPFWRMMMLFVTIYLIVRSFFSMSYGDIPFPISMVLGISLAQISMQYENDNKLNVKLE